MNQITSQDGVFIATLNQMGYMTTFLDPYSQGFVDYAAGCQAWCLEIGAAFGVATLAALERGAKIIANDLDERHLDHIAKHCPKAQLPYLKLVAGAFPQNISFADHSVAAILISRVLHFFSGEQIRAALQVCYRWLKPDGRLYIVAETPYLGNWKKFIPIYERRKAEKHMWPGWIEDVSLFAASRVAQLPKQIHFLDKEVLERELTRANFKNVRIEHLNRNEFPEDLRLDGRESVAALASI